MFKRFNGFFQEDNGNFSNTRLVAFVWGLGSFILWAYTSLSTGTLASMPESIVGVLAIIMVGKVSQKFGEKNPEE